MTFVKDWVREIAKEITAAQCGWHDNEDEIVELIIKHCPFKEDTAYMPVPRCETCRHWEFATTGLRGRIGRCKAIDAIDDGKVWINYRMNNTALYTVSDFGCVQWERR